MPDNTVLCGFMGSGKTTVGKLLAQMTGRRFIDTDRMIEEKAGKSISCIFREFGEQYFRRLEYNTVKDLSYVSHCIISVGGGAASEEETAAIMRSLGTVVLLDVSKEQVMLRLNGNGTRPVLGNGDREKTIEELFKARLPLYKAAADYVVCADGSPKETADAIIKLLSL